MDNTMVIPADEDDKSTSRSKLSSKELKAQRDARYREKKKAKGDKPTTVSKPAKPAKPVKAEVAEPEDAVPLKQPKKPSAVRLREARAVSRAPVKGKLTMDKTYQRAGAVATGTEIAGGARQTVITFPKEMFAQVGAEAMRNGVSFSEQVRRCVRRALGAVAT